MIDLSDIQINKPELIFQGKARYALIASLHQNLFPQATHALSDYPESTLTIVETTPRTRTILLTQQDCFERRMVSKTSFVLSFPFIQYYCFHNEVQTYVTATFSTKSAKEEFTTFYQPPLPNFSPFMCIGGVGHNLVNYIQTVQQFVDFFWTTPFVCDRHSDCGWLYLKILFPKASGASGEFGFGYFKEWEKASRENPNFIMDEAFFKKPWIFDSASNILKQARQKALVQGLANSLNGELHDDSNWS